MDEIIVNNSESAEIGKQSGLKNRCQNDLGVRISSL